MTFDHVIDDIIQREGGYVDHPSDRGGPTMYGITEAVARENHYTGAMVTLPRPLAASIYLRRYITIPFFDQVWQIDNDVGNELIDTGIVMGPSVPSLFFQRWLNAFNLRGKIYPDLFADGRIGNVTLRAFRSLVAYRGQTETSRVMVAALNGLQAGRFLDIAERNQTQEDFLWGWIAGRVANNDAG